MSDTAATKPVLHSEIAKHDLHNIWVRGENLTEEVMGERSFTEVVFLMLTQRYPDPQELRLLDAVLVSLVEHGLTPSALVARVTYGVEPDSIQGAVAAGLLGVGGLVLGSMEECGKLLTRIAEEVAAGGRVPDAARQIALEYREERRKLPGVGHAIHTEGDPRAARLLRIAEETGHAGAHVEAVRELVAAGERLVGRPLPLNVTGAVAALLLELGVPWRLHRGFALVSRTAGLVAHVGEEIEDPITPGIRKLAREQH